MDISYLLSMPVVKIFIFLYIIGFIFIVIGYKNKAEILISPIKGFVIGALVNDETFIEDDNTSTEYTLQCLIGVISITVIWEVNG
jgi:membrane-bound ClpP family serine protease